MRKEKFCKPYFSKRKHNVGCTQKNRLNGTVLLSSEYPKFWDHNLVCKFHHGQTRMGQNKKSILRPNLRSMSTQAYFNMNKK